MFGLRELEDESGREWSRRAREADRTLDGGCVVIGRLVSGAVHLSALESTKNAAQVEQFHAADGDSDARVTLAELTAHLYSVAAMESLAKYSRPQLEADVASGHKTDATLFASATDADGLVQFIEGGRLAAWLGNVERSIVGPYYTGARRTGLFPREPDFWNRSQIFGKGACLTYRSLISEIGA